jgi:hypothetical protein
MGNNPTMAWGKTLPGEKGGGGRGGEGEKGEVISDQ